MKEIIFIIGNYKNGGVAMRSTNLANQFAGYGYQVTLLSTKEIGADVYFKREVNVTLISLADYLKEHDGDLNVKKVSVSVQNRIRFYKATRRIAGRSRKMDHRLAAEIRGLRRGEALREFLYSHKGAILIPFGFACYEMAYYASRGLGCKLVYAERNAAELECPSGVDEKAEAMRILGKADGAVLQTRDELAFYKDCAWRNADVIHNPVKPDLPEPYHGERRKTVVNFCRVSAQKNLPLLIGAFEKLHQVYSDYSLEIYGNTVGENEDALKEELISLLRENGQDGYIHFLPPAADVHQKVRDAAMFVSSSDFEGLSNSMIEAMTIGLPCVCTDCLGGGARELIRDGENGLLTPIGDEDALYRAMKRMIDEPALAAWCGEKAAEIRDELAAEKIGKQWMSLIERL